MIQPINAYTLTTPYNKPSAQKVRRIGEMTSNVFTLTGLASIGGLAMHCLVEDAKNAKVKRWWA
jgi:hypothetical protein